MATTDTTTTTAEAIADGIGELVRPDKAPYWRILVNGETLAYADDRAEGVMLSVDQATVDAAVEKFEEKDGRVWLRVTEENVETARAFLAWLAIS